MTIFRVDFGSSVGLGHLMRSLVYAKRFNEVVYISKSNQKEMLPYPLITIQNEEEFFLHVKKLQPKEVVIDNYAFTIEYQKKFKQLFPYIKLSCFDDEYKEYACDEIINHNLGAKKKYYKEPNKVKLITPLIREAFIKTKKRRYRKKEKIVISFGGSDAKGLSLRTLWLLRGLCVDLFITYHNKDIKKLKRFTFLHKNVTLHIDKEIAPILAQAKIAIVTPSTIAYEAIYLDTNFIAVQVAKNQDMLVRYLKKKRYTVLQERELWKIHSKLLLQMRLELKKR